jgi:hypothetical protein
MRLGVVFRLGALGAALGVAATLRAAWPERKVFQFGEFTIEAPAGEEAYVEALAVRLAEYKLPPRPAPPVLKLSLDELARRREYFLGRLAALFGLEKFPSKMAEDYDESIVLARAIVSPVPTAMPRRFALWRRPELRARIAAGESIPGFIRGANGDPSFDQRLTGEPEPVKPGNGAAAGMAWRYTLWPIEIVPADGRTPDEQAAAALVRMGEFYSTEAAASLEKSARARVFMVLHDAVGSALVSQYLSSKDRRWFCEGVANYAASKTIEGEVGAVEADHYFDLAGGLKKFSAFAGRVNLVDWPLADDAAVTNAPAELEIARGIYATEVIADLCTRHGGDILPKLLVEIGKTKREKATMSTVYKACKKLTGENLRVSLAKPPSGS